MAKQRIHKKTSSRGTQKAATGLAAKLAAVEATAIRSDYPDYGPGDTVKVHVRIKEGDKERIQIYEGVVIAQYNKGANKSFNVRKMSHGVGVERIFQEASPKVAKLEIVSSGKVRRAKLYYLRELEGRAAKLDKKVEAQTAPKAEKAAK